jgi:hypothetical protein
LECWDYEEKFGKPRENTIIVSHANMPSLPAKKLLRRLDELRRGIGKFGWNPTQEEADLREFTGNVGCVQQYQFKLLFFDRTGVQHVQHRQIQQLIKLYS